jgi:hypothetical protein
MAYYLSNAQTVLFRKPCEILLERHADGRPMIKDILGIYLQGSQLAQDRGQ